MKDDNFWKRQTREHRLLNHLPMNHRKYIIERFQILQQGEGLRDYLQDYLQKNLLNIKAEGYS